MTICVIHSCENMWVSELPWKTNPTFLCKVTDWDARGQAYWFFLLSTLPSHTRTVNEPSSLWKVTNLCCMTLTVTAGLPRALFLTWLPPPCAQAVLPDRVASCSHPWPASTRAATPLPLCPVTSCLSLPLFAWIGGIPYVGACRGLCALLPLYQDYFSDTSQHKITTVEEIICCTLIQKQAQNCNQALHYLMGWHQQIKTVSKHF